HRDLKPANVLIDGDDQPHVTDFGLAKQLEEESGLTLSGTILGTPSYMSPEQAAGRNDEVGPASDVYGLRAILFFLLTGGPPFQGTTGAETISMVISDEPRSIRSVNPKCSRSLVTICEKCLRKNPQERYQTAQELAVELERFLRGDPIQAQPMGRLKRSWMWCRDIPLVAALIGRTPSSNNRRQVQTQWMVLILLACFGLLVCVNAIRAAMLPDEFVIATGAHGGMYHHIAPQLGKSLEQTTGRSVRLLETKGSFENRDLVVSGNAHLGFLQASAMDVEKVAVVAPLYREFCFVIVRKDFPIDARSPDLSLLEGHTIIVGPEGSGNRESAIKILRYFGVTDRNASFSPNSLDEFEGNHAIHAAIVISGLESPSLKALLETGKFRLLPIPP
ncbi:MAG: protein kinase, partial [Planctomycetaceae bacterium]|nr:protein kinase [Planctomycetaceae bacterium]